MIVDVLTYLRPATVLLCLMLSVHLFTIGKRPSLQNSLLALFVLSIGIELSSRIVWWHVPTMQEFRPFFVILLDFRFIISPLFYLYLRSAFRPEKRPGPHDAMHGVVFILVMALQFASRQFWLQPWKAFILTDMLQMAAYLGVSFFRFGMHRLFSNPAYFGFDRRKIIWLRFFLISLLATLGVLVASWLLALGLFRIPDWDYWMMRLAGFVSFVFVGAVVMAALRAPGLFRSLRKRSAPLPEALRERYRERLHDHMLNDKPYRNPAISLHSLAKEVGIPAKHLSAVINEFYGRNFYRYVNSYRIDECKRMLGRDSGNGFNILEIAYETGFNSKNSFNLAFREETGMTPSQYREGARKKNTAHGY